MTPRTWRIITVLAATACFAVGAQSAAAIDLVDPARIPANPEGTITAAADTSAKSNETADSLRSDAENANSDFHHDAGDSGGSGGGSSPSSPSSVPSSVDWCRWWAFQTAADNLQMDPSLDVYAELEGDIENCLTNYYPNDTNVSWVAPYLALQNIASLLVAVGQANGTADAYQQLQGSVMLPTQTWVAWFQASARALG
jgi:hypothetical protein